MGDEEPREYDKEFTARVAHRARYRFGITTDRGTVQHFVVQLEYLLDPGDDEWAEVVRYDHDSGGSSEATHDVTLDGLHIDVYREGEKITSNELTPPLPANEALDRAEEHLNKNAEGYIKRFETWHSIETTR